MPALAPETVGKHVTKIPVELSTRFLEHFSEQLYSSPQKAFEELISNGWDAGATCVDVRVSQNLAASDATMCVFDNGASMDEAGLRELWHIAFSPKRDKTEQHGRAIIGKFGIGKLATYVLAEKLTYICKAADGIIRRVTMDYRDIDRQRKQKGATRDTLISELELDVFTVAEKDLGDALKPVYGGADILNFIQSGVDNIENDPGEDEYGGPASSFTPPNSGTWTLVVLSGIKPIGRTLKLGILKRMLRSALPFGSEMLIRVNGDPLKSSKIDTPTILEWTIGPDLEISEFEYEEDAQTDTEEHTVESEKKTPAEVIKVISDKTPYPYVEISGVGRLTGKVKLFREPVSGVKSDKRGASNGFHINVLGRVVNQGNIAFGEKDLSHAAWARFRMTIRADGLNGFLNTNREQFREQRELKIFRAFLRKVFNKARTQYDDDINAALSDGGDLLVRSLGVLSLNPLRNIVAETLKTKAPLPDLFDESGVNDKTAKLTEWKQETADKISSALGEVKYEKSDDDSFVKFRLADNSIVINKEHPFVMEYSRTKAEKELLRTVAMVSLLSDVYALDAGVDADALRNIREYRDRLMRFLAMQSRQSGIYIAKLLLETQHCSAQSKQLEMVVSDALRYIGFQVRDIAKSGEPEGIASAFPTPTRSMPTSDNPNPPLYSFTFDAKSSKHEEVKTGNVSLDAIVEHRNRYKANYALVVAPGYSGDAIKTRCAEQKVTPVTAHDLGRLLEYTVKFGALPLDKLQEMFSIYDHEQVSVWVSGLENWLKKKRTLSIDIFIKAIEELKGKVPDALPAAMISYQCRERLGAKSVRDEDVRRLAQGLSILVPDLVGVADDKIIINASATHVAEAIKAQLESLHTEESSS